MREESCAGVCRRVAGGSAGIPATRLQLLEVRLQLLEVTAELLEVIFRSQGAVAEELEVLLQRLSSTLEQLEVTSRGITRR